MKDQISRTNTLTKSEKNAQDKKPQDTPSKSEDILFDNRTLTIFGEINHKSALGTARSLLAMSQKSDAPITIYISSPGGHVESGDVIYDLIQFIKPQVRVVGTGWVGSIAVHIYLAAKKANRYCLPNTRFLIHQPSGGFGGTASDIAIHAREIIKIRERINKIIAERTKKSLEQINIDTNRDNWMTAKESLEYGLVGKIIKSVADIK